MAFKQKAFLRKMPGMNWFSKLKDGLKKTTKSIVAGVEHALTARKLDENTLSQLEEALLQADMGIETSDALLAPLRKERFGKDTTVEDVQKTLAEGITKILNPVALPLEMSKHKPQVILLSGVNGAGKTTTLAKLAEKYRAEGKKVLVAAGDTYRAGAAAQLEVWAKRVGCPIVQADKDGADPSGVLYKALEKAQAEKFDILLADTAGRLQNRKDLMDQLDKMIRVLKKLDASAPHHSLLVLDATVGQNAFSQVELFKPIAQVTGLVVTKLDSTAKGGVVVGLAQKFKLPIHFVGVGEKVSDLDSFKPEEFARSLVGID